MKISSKVIWTKRNLFAWENKKIGEENLKTTKCYFGIMRKMATSSHLSFKYATTKISLPFFCSSFLFSLYHSSFGLRLLTLSEEESGGVDASLAPDIITPTFTTVSISHLSFYLCLFFFQVLNNKNVKLSYLQQWHVSAEKPQSSHLISIVIIILCFLKFMFDNVQRWKFTILASLYTH